MKKFFLKLITSKIFTGSITILVGSAFASFGNYLYHLFMGRMLGPSDYGSLASLISLMTLLSLPVGTLGLVLVKYVSSFRGKKELASISYLFSWINKKLVAISLVVCAVLLPLSPTISNFLHLDTIPLVWIVVGVTILGIYQTISSSFLQGFLQFFSLSLLGIVQCFTKLFLGLILVTIGFKVYGASMAILLSTVLVDLLIYFQVKKVIKVKKQRKPELDISDLRSYAITAFITSVAFTSFFTTDVVLSKHFLSSHDAGLYAALSTLGKIIYFAASPISIAMFPMISENHSKGEKYNHLFLFSASMVICISLLISIIYYFYPGLMIKLLFGSSYLSASSNLYLFAIFSSLYSLTYLFSNFYLSIHNTKIVFISAFAALAQVVLIYFFHHSVRQIITISDLALGLLLGLFLLYYLLNYAKTKEKTSLSYSPSI